MLALIVAARTGPLFNALTHFKIVTPTALFGSFQNRPARMLIVAEMTVLLLSAPTHFKIVIPSVFFGSFQNRQALSIFSSGAPARGSNGTREIISKIDQPQHFSSGPLHKAPRVAHGIISKCLRD